MKMIYLAHPYAGFTENVCKATDLERSIADEKIHVFNAVAYFTRYHGMLTENQIMARCLDMLCRVDELWMANGWETSKGCRKEHEFAKKFDIKVVYLDGSGERILFDRYGGVEE